MQTFLTQIFYSRVKLYGSIGFIQYLGIYVICKKKLYPKSQRQGHFLAAYFKHIHILLFFGIEKCIIADKNDICNITVARQNIRDKKKRRKHACPCLKYSLNIKIFFVNTSILKFHNIYQQNHLITYFKLMPPIQLSALFGPERDLILNNYSRRQRYKQAYVVVYVDYGKSQFSPSNFRFFFLSTLIFPLWLFYIFSGSTFMCVT